MGAIVGIVIIFAMVFGGYVAAGDVSPNTDYRWLELPARKGESRAPRLGPGAPCWPYAPAIGLCHPSAPWPWTQTA